MNPWFAKAAILAGIIAMSVIRAPHVRRSIRVKVVASRNSALDYFSVALVFVGLLFVPILWIATPMLSFAEHPLRPVPFAGGIICVTLGLWLLHRSHVDLGTNWSNELEVREGHKLVADGIYRRVRHPMYLALLLHGAGQLLLLPNWVAGPSFLVAFGVLVAFRLAREERMMLETFGEDYANYMARTKRLVPGVW